MHRRLLALSVLLLVLLRASSIQGEQQCQAITYYECKNIGYNQTYLPNKFNHQDQKDVALVVSVCHVCVTTIDERELTSLRIDGVIRPRNYRARLTCVITNR